MTFCSAKVKIAIKPFCIMNVFVSEASFCFSQWTTASFNFHQMAVHKRTTMLAYCNLKQNTWLCSKQSSFFSFYALPSGGKSKDMVVHWRHSILNLYIRVCMDLNQYGLKLESYSKFICDWKISALII